MDLTKDDFDAHFADMEKAIAECDFMALDFEMSGISMSDKKNQPNYMDSPQVSISQVFFKEDPAICAPAGVISGRMVLVLHAGTLRQDASRDEPVLHHPVGPGDVHQGGWRGWPENLCPPLQHVCLPGLGVSQQWQEADGDTRLALFASALFHPVGRPGSRMWVLVGVGLVVQFGGGAERGRHQLP